MEPELEKAVERLKKWWGEQSWAEVEGYEVIIDGSAYNLVEMACAALGAPLPFNL